MSQYLPYILALVIFTIVILSILNWRNRKMLGKLINESEKLIAQLKAELAKIEEDVEFLDATMKAWDEVVHKLPLNVKYKIEGLKKPVLLVDRFVNKNFHIVLCFKGREKFTADTLEKLAQLLKIQPVA